MSGFRFSQSGLGVSFLIQRGSGLLCSCAQIFELSLVLVIVFGISVFWHSTSEFWMWVQEIWTRVVAMSDVPESRNCTS